MVAHVGAPVTIRRELRQARKGATVVANSGTGVSLAWAATFLSPQRCTQRLAAYGRVSGNLHDSKSSGVVPMLRVLPVPDPSSHKR